MQVSFDILHLHAIIHTHFGGILYTVHIHIQTEMNQIMLSHLNIYKPHTSLVNVGITQNNLTIP